MLLLLTAFATAAPEVHTDLSAQWSPETLVLGVGGRLEGEDDGYLLLSGRIDPSGAYLGRAGFGFDLFGDGDTMDLRFGLFLGETGNLLDRTVLRRPAAGVEVEFGMHLGSAYGSLRHLDGFSGPLEQRLTENEVRVGFEVDEHLLVHGQYGRFNPGELRPVGGFGAGVELVF